MTFQLVDSDRGELTIGLETLHDGASNTLLMDFSAPLRWLALDADDALALARAILALYQPEMTAPSGPTSE